MGHLHGAQTLLKERIGILNFLLLLIDLLLCLSNRCLGGIDVVEQERNLLFQDIALLLQRIFAVLRILNGVAQLRELLFDLFQLLLELVYLITSVCGLNSSESERKCDQSGERQT